MSLDAIDGVCDWRREAGAEKGSFIIVITGGCVVPAAQDVERGGVAVIVFLAFFIDVVGGVHKR